MTKYLALATVALSAALTAGCSEVASLNEFVTADEAIMDRALLGVWTSGDSTFAIGADGNEYAIRYLDKGNSCAKFQGRMVQVGDVRILDVVQDSDDSFSIAVHMLVRVSIEANRLIWQFVDSDAIKDETARRFSIHKDGKRIVIVETGDQWRKTMWKLAAESSAGKGEVVTRVP